MDFPFSPMHGKPSWLSKFLFTSSNMFLSIVIRKNILDTFQSEIEKVITLPPNKMQSGISVRRLSTKHNVNIVN